ncbi:MAG: LPS assembly protein LptD [Alphaproteobacteria bacterium]|nr:LPS assembly protein LptD [Alphaproteobacteria bacterium]
MIKNKFILLATTAFIAMPLIAKSESLEVRRNLFNEETPYIEESKYVPVVKPKQDIMEFTNLKSQKVEKENKEIYFSADEVESSSQADVVIARGNVNIVRESVTLQADEVVYDKAQDIIEAKGNVVLLNAEGDVIFSDYVNLRENLDEVSMDNIKIIMKDQTHLAAKKATKYKNNNKLMEKAVYSACDLCATSDPLWQLKARKIRHDAEAKDVNYNDVFLEIKGLPILYAPFFSHPDPTVKRRSGFLSPSLVSSNYFGMKVMSRYFFDISDHENLTLSPGYSTKVGPIMAVDYDKYFYSGRLKFSASGLRDDKNSKLMNKDRGHLFLKSNYEINDLWVSDFDFNYVSDRTYLKDMSLRGKDDAWLISSAKFQRFDNRNYAGIESYYYKQISYDLRQQQKPYVVPLVNYEHYGEMNQYGFYNKNELGLASIYRSEGDESQRISMINSWVLPGTTSYGAKHKLMASVKSDLYYITNYQYATGSDDYDGSVGRIFPQLSYEWRLPFVKATGETRQIVEPIVVGVLAPNGGNKANKIPNNDSLGVRIDDTNILDVDRYAGYDKNDTGSRVSYGVNWSSYGNIFGRTSLLIAQSYKMRREESFLNYSEDNSYLSNYFGRFYANPSKYLDVNYRFALNRKNYNLEYSELSSTFGPKLLRFYVSYIYLKDDATYSISNYNERRELYFSISSQLTRDWSARIYDRIDLTKNGGTLEYGGSLIYEDECFKMGTNISKEISNDPQYKNNFEITVDFYLKTLGGIGSK